MTLNPNATQVAAVAELLRELLTTHTRYVRIWGVHGARRRGEVNQRAVARVLALYLWEQGIKPDTDKDLPERLKNVVNRALQGQRLTAQTLEYLIGAFEMDEDDERQLWQAFSASSGVVNTIRKPRPMAKPQWHRTVALFENWYIDAEGRLIRRHVVQAIEAQKNGVDGYFFEHDQHVTQIEVINGGRLGRHYEYGEVLVGDEFALDRVLREGERAPLEYEAFFEDGFRPLEVRRIARARSKNVALTVHFDPKRVPARIWFAVWADYLVGDPERQDVIELSDSCTVWRFVEQIEQAVVGFRWEW